MNTRYDVAIIGCGEAGIFAGYELMRRHPALKVVTLDQAPISTPGAVPSSPER